MKKDTERKNGTKTKKKFSYLPIVVALAILIPLFGNVTASVNSRQCEIDSLIFKTNFGYDNIKSVSLETHLDKGSPKLALPAINVVTGYYQNKEYGKYELFIYKDVELYIVIEMINGKYVVYNLATEKQTRESYEALSGYWAKPAN